MLYASSDSATVEPLLVIVSNNLFINPRRRCAGGLRYLSCVYVCLCVCVSVCYHSIGNICRFYAQNEVHSGLS